MTALRLGLEEPDWTTFLAQNVNCRPTESRYFAHYSTNTEIHSINCHSYVEFRGVRVELSYWVGPDQDDIGLEISVMSDHFNAVWSHSRATVEQVLRTSPYAEWRNKPADWLINI